MTTTTLADAARHDDGPAAPVPLVDLGLQHRRIAAEVRPAMDAVMDTTAFVLGPEVTAFEQEYAAFCGAAHCVGVGNGTDAIELALRGAGIGSGDEVLIPANTFVATAEAVVRAGAVPVLADCDEHYLLDPEDLAHRVTSRTRAVIAVDLYGQVAEIERISEAVGPDVLVLEDAAQSQGATRAGRVAGSFGTAAATSFYPGKNLGAYGDAGAVVTQDRETAERIRALRSHGGLRRYEHTHLGTNSRLDSLQAAVLRVKLRHLPEWNDERRAAAALYTHLLGDLETVVLPRTLEDNEHVWHLFVVRVADRDRVAARLQAAGIGAAIHYPAPVHRLPAFAGLLASSRGLTRSERYAGEILSLPLYPGITTAQVERVAHELRGAIGGTSEVPRG
ncbi:DegT/DnrJ/EryC1/StrS family aminotransferase [Microlunatus capsulatus]|uniref:dTDP-4-amino-4,6-dideoxygalactose transaminase n=1 Tax=Microlunatus capsulatus TaxID=99117 RepID=A0ABS4ZBY1_9ACTN|nr:DegT/DnrJ/EryC1/StrS family aminotransferase [Microlunatus capsulatus]MBP2418568.1 dTDP-4-amino-4,6-dideoxygalactose transaminase [Microlunatus capsulatus]